MTRDLKQNLLYLAEFRSGDFGNAEVRARAFEAVDGFVCFFLVNDANERDRVIQEIPRNASFAFLAYAWEMAVQSVRQKRSELLRKGLLALAIENERVDSRDTLRALALISHSAEKLGHLSLDPLFKEVAGMSSEPFRRTLNAFVGRQRELLSPGAYGMQETTPPEPFGYKEIGRPRGKSVLRTLFRKR